MRLPSFKMEIKASSYSIMVKANQSVVNGICSCMTLDPSPSYDRGRGSSDMGSSSGRGHCVVFLGKTLYPRSASLHSGVLMGTGEFNAGGQPCDGLASHPGGAQILLVDSCYWCHLARMQTSPFFFYPIECNTLFVIMKPLNRSKSHGLCTSCIVFTCVPIMKHVSRLKVSLSTKRWKMHPAGFKYRDTAIQR